jgi:hypothetical protein
MLKAFTDADANCCFLHGLDAHESILANVAHGASGDKWKKVVAAWCSKRRR